MYEATVPVIVTVWFATSVPEPKVKPVGPYSISYEVAEEQPCSHAKSAEFDPGGVSRFALNRPALGHAGAGAIVII